MARPRDRGSRDCGARVQGPRGRGVASDDRRIVGDRSRAAGRRRDQHRPRRPRLRLAGRVVWTPVRRAPSGRTEEREAGERQCPDEGRRGTHLLLGAVDRPVRDDLLHGRSVPRVEGQPVHRRDGGAAPGPPGPERRARRRRGEAAGRSKSSASARSVRDRTATSTSSWAPIWCACRRRSRGSGLFSGTWRGRRGRPCLPSSRTPALQFGDVGEARTDETRCRRCRVVCCSWPGRPYCAIRAHTGTGRAAGLAARRRARRRGLHARHPRHEQPGRDRRVLQGGLRPRQPDPAVSQRDAAGADQLARREPAGVDAADSRRASTSS